MASPAYTPLGEQLPDSASEGDNSEIREEVGIDLTPESVDPDQIVIKVRCVCMYMISMIYQ